jgi:polyisoprenoid-binding protein YceI
MLILKYSFTVDKRLAGFLLVLASMIASMLAGCTAQISTTALRDDLHMPANFPAAYYQQARAAGAKVLRIDTKSSLLTIYVRRGGLLARLGHDHVIASHDVNGYVDTSAGRADLYVPLERLAVDEPALRSEAGFTTQPSESDIEGTRRNMQNKVLESASYPYALIRINRTTADRSNLNVTITLHGTTHTYEIPAKIETVADVLIISGQMSINQTAFGITPFSILGGALQVQDRVDLRFRILAAAQS